MFAISSESSPDDNVRFSAKGRFATSGDHMTTLTGAFDFGHGFLLVGHSKDALNLTGVFELEACDRQTRGRTDRRTDNRFA